VTETEDVERAERLRDEATRWLSPIGGRTAKDLLAAMPASVDGDVYGDGGAVTELESEVASAVGHEAALLFPTGTMAQQVALRLHADATGCRTVAMHPLSHPLVHENDALTRVQGLDVRVVGDRRRPATAGDLDDVAEPLAAVLLELPQRELGGMLPAWDDLVAHVQAVRGRGAAVHLDGARLWECEPAYGRDAAEIAGLFDTVYVSLYKGLGAIAGACLAGPQEVVDQAAEWRHRLGGRPFGLWPYAASGLAALGANRSRMGPRLEHLRDVAGAVSTLDGVEVVPDPPQAALCQVHLRTTPDDYREAMLRLAEDEGVWAWREPAPTDRPGWLMVELHASDNLLAFTPEEVAHMIARLRS
jgi:threonine aldolase